MEAVKQWGLSLCAAVMAGGIIHMMSPDSEMGKIMKVTISVFLLVSIFSPLLSAGTGLELDLSEPDRASDEIYASVQEQVDSQLIESSEKTLERLIAEHLEAYGITGSDIDVTASFDDGGQIFARKIIIRVDGEYIGNKYVIEERLKQQLGLDCRVVSKTV